MQDVRQDEEFVWENKIYSPFFYFKHDLILNQLSVSSMFDLLFHFKRMLRRYLLHSGPATQILRAINWATIFAAMMIFGAAFYSLMISSDDKITAVVPMSSWGSTLLFGSGIVLMLLSIKGCTLPVPRGLFGFDIFALERIRRTTCESYLI